MNERVRHLIRDLLGRSDRLFVDLLCGQVDAALEGARLLKDAATGDSSAEDVAARMAQIEDDGDDYRSQLIQHLSRSLTTPVDREDLFRLSRSIDDVLDSLRDFADELVLFGAQSRELFEPPLNALISGLEAMRDAVMDLLRAPGRVSVTARAAKHANKVHAAYQQAIAQLFEGDVSTDMLAYRELLRRVDIAGLRLETAADVLSDAGLKRG